MNKTPEILILNLPGLVLKSGSRWYNITKKGAASLRYYPYPWFMGYCASLLKQHGFNTVLIDAVAMEWTQQQTLEYIASRRPTHIICEPTWASINDDAVLLSAIDTSIQVITVGNYATNFPVECLQKTGSDCVIIGEYEFSVLSYFMSGCTTLPVNAVSKTKRDFDLPKLVEDLDIFPFPERDDTPITYYNEPSCYGRNVVMVSSRGCRLRCGFCNVECIYGRHVYRTRSAANVADEIEYLKAKYTFDEIYFDDDNMVSRKSHIDGICREIIDRNIKVKWLCMGDGLVDNETLELLAKAGCVTYKYGLEHLDEKVLKAIPKPLKRDRLLEIIQVCKDVKMRSYVNLIIGLPGSTFEKDRSMMEDVIQAGPDLLQIAIATPYPGTAFYKDAKRKGWLVSEDPAYFDATGRSAVSYPDYPAEKIIEMFHLGWKMWYRHVFSRKPGTLWFFVRSEARRNGWFATVKKACAYLTKTAAP